MAKKVVSPLPLHVVQQINVTIDSATQAIAVISALSDRLLIVTDATTGMEEFAHRIDFGLNRIGTTTACKLHDDLQALKACLNQRNV